jgi:serine protease Do
MVKKWKSNLIIVFGVVVVSLLTGMVISAKLGWVASTDAASKTEGQGPESGAAFANPFVDIARRGTPAVVNISTTKIIKGHRRFQVPPGQRGPSPFENFPRDDDFFERFFGVPERDLKQRSLGSGFIISQDGLILTNNHVVENADDIKVTLADGKSYEAEIKGLDPKTDIALIKIEAKNDLPVAILGDSDRLEVGEWVMAIGNPSGLSHSVTVGVVSFKGRRIGAGPYDDFIQTDASINPGNSGGPLINVQGKVVGINTAIIASAQGIGFAIPINQATGIIDQLKEKGSVTRGWLGVQVQEINPELAHTLKLPTAEGALIAGVFKGDPADKGGVVIGDVVIEFDGEPVRSDRDLVFQVGKTEVGKKLSLTVVRDGKKVSLEVVIAERLDEETLLGGRKEEPEDPGPLSLGITGQTMTEELAGKFGLDEATGVLVTDVESGGPADKAEIERGDIIIEVNRKPVKTVKELAVLLKEADTEESLLFLVRRGPANLFLVVKPEAEK